MNDKIIIKNEFTGGVAADFDPQKIGNKTLTYSLNGRVIYNDSGTLSWGNGNGNKLAITIGFDYGAAHDYTIIGSIEISNYLILFSTKNNFTDLTTSPPNRKNSEIGLLNENQRGTYSYQTIFNDKYDPNGDLLHFNTRYQIKAQAIFENKDKIRVYWCDDYNEDRVFNIVAGATLYLDPRNGITYFANPNQYKPVPNNPITGASRYPYWYSVHGMNNMCDVQYGLMKYVKNVKGNLNSGVRQYTYRLVQQSGYATPWAPLSGEIFLTSDQVNTEDWNQYQMQASATPTNKGIQIEIKYIDTRFQFIEVAEALYDTNTAPISATVFYEGLITGTDMIINHTDNKGLVPIPDPSVLVQRYLDIVHSKTMLINENYIHKSNLVLRPNLSIDVTGVTLAPKLKLMISDELGGESKAPLTHQVPKTTTITKDLFSGLSEVYQVENDYINYKGTQWTNLFTSYFRESIYPFAIVLFNRKGQPFFAQSIGDFQFPTQFGNQWNLQTTTGTTTGTTGSVGDYVLCNFSPGSAAPVTDTINQGNNFCINIMGLEVSGIDLTDVLYDQYGELQISGFSIVRTERIPDIIGQGLVMNCTIDQPFQNNAPTVRPLHSSGNAYKTLSVSGGIAWQNGTIDHGNYNNNVGLLGDQIQGGIITFECPDFMINQGIISNQTTYDLEIVGNCQAAFLPNGVSGSEPLQLDGTHGHFYTKQYTTYMGGVTWYNAQEPTPGGTPVGIEPFTRWGMQQQITEIVPDVFQQGNLGIGSGYFKINNYDVLLNSFYPPLSSVNDNFHACGHEHSIFMNTSPTDFTTTDELFLNLSSWVTPWGNQDDVNNISYFIANYRTGLPNYQLNQAVLASRTYRNIGHFIPINPTIITAATQPNGRVVFNNCEVWGGDCYPDYFGYTRLYPSYQGQDNPTLDYAFGLVFPVESQYNHTMRAGNFYTRVGTRPETTERQSGSISTSLWEDGMFIDSKSTTNERIEDFNVNSALQTLDAISAYFTTGVYFQDENDFSLIECYAGPKISGETYDTYRDFLVNNTQLADSQYGWVCDLEALGINIYVLQEKGFGRIRFNERTLESTSQANLTVGTGQGYEGHDYLGGAQWGCQHEWSVINNKRDIYWVNAYKGKHNRFGGNGLECLSDIYGQHNYFRDAAENYWQIGAGPLTDTNENIYDNPVSIGGIASVYDYNNKAEINTFTQQLIYAPVGTANRVIINPNVTATTMEYGDASSHYEGNWNFYPGIYFSFKQDYFSPDRLNPANFYVHNEGAKGNFYGIVFPSQFEFIVKAERQFLYDNIEIDTTPSAFGVVKSVIAETVNGTQTMILNNPALDNRYVYRNSAILGPLMAINQSTRVRGSYADLLYEIDNASNTSVLISEHRTFCRPDFR